MNEIVITPPVLCSVEVSPVDGASVEYSLVTVGLRGPQGEPGITDIGGYPSIVADVQPFDVLQFSNGAWRNFPKITEFVQAVEAATWTINHNLGYKPLVQIFSVGGLEMLADVLHVSENVLQVIFSQPSAGSARLN